MSWGKCPNCESEILEKKYLKKLRFKITEICPSCGTPLSRNKINQIVIHGKKKTIIQYTIVSIFLASCITYFLFKN